MRTEGNEKIEGRVMRRRKCRNRGSIEMCCPVVFSVIVVGSARTVFRDLDFRFKQARRTVARSAFTAESELG